MKTSSLLSLAFLSFTGASSIPSEHQPGLLKRDTCENSATNRSCWGDYNINTNYYTTWPTTGNTVEYWLSIENTTLAPDGYSRQVLAINGSIPGPTIIANWGDQIVVHVTNNLQNNGTSIHWHGIRQLYTNDNDGANGITECPLAPGKSKTYTFTATQYGTSWYHSHHSAQYGDGVFGTILINGPASANYDEDLGTLTLSDWFYQTAFQEAYIADHKAPPTANNFLINGTNVNVAETTGTRFSATFESGKKYRLRLINTAVDSGYKFGIDGHTLTVIASDFVPITPYNTTWLNIAIGQRYDIIVEANQAVSSYWLRAVLQSGCGSNDNPGTGTATGYIAYSGYTALPTSTISTYTNACVDESLASLVPIVDVTVDSSGFAAGAEEVTVKGPTKVSSSTGTVFRWTINGEAMQVDWAYPTLLQLSDGNTTWGTADNVIVVNSSVWTYWVIQNGGGATHPIHLHGHDYSIISQGSGTFSASTATINYSNPPRRDVALLPSSGYLVIAFLADNPGAWLMHCHIAWHVGEGLSLQYIELQDQIFDHVTLSSEWTQTCADWAAYYDAKPAYAQEDSGL